MAGIPFLHNIDLKDNQLLNAKLHTSGTAPSNPGTGTIWYDSDNSLVKVYDSGWNTISGDITGVTSATTNQLTVANSGGPAPAFSIVTAAIANGGTGLATADQIHTFVTTQTDDIAASTTGTAAIATTVTVADESSDTTCFPLFATAATGNLGPKSGSNLTFNSATGILTATGFAGDITGNVTGNTSGSAGTVTSIGNLTGDVTSTNRATTIAADAVHHGMLNDDIISGQAEFDIATIAAADEMMISDGGVIKRVGVDDLKDNYFNTVSVANLKTSLAGGFGSNAVTIGDSDDVVTIGNDLIVTGDLTVSGDTVTVNTATLSVEDPLIILAKNNNSSDAVDIGLYGLYDTSGSQDLYSGLFRDANDSGKWKLFKDLQAAPTTTVDTSGTGYATGTLVANIEGSLTIGGHTVADIDIGSEFNDVDDHLMSSGAIKEKIENYGYTTDANVTHRPVTAGGNTLANSETLAFTAGSNVTITESAGAVTIASTDTNTNTQLATAAALVDVSAMAGNSTASFTHSLSSKNLIVQLYDTTSGKVVHADIDHTSTDAIAITFAQTGTQMVAASIGDIRVVVIDAVHGVSDSTVAYS